MAIELKVKEKAARLFLDMQSDRTAVLTFSGRAIATQKKRITPNDFEQTVTGDDGFLLSEVIIDPIPSYYGHIAYNGGVLTVY